jgi:uncharacterized protein
MAHEVTDDEGRAASGGARRPGGILTFAHAGVPRESEGKGIGAPPVRGALDNARAKGSRVVARCGFVAACVEGHPACRDRAPTCAAR